MKLGSRAPLPVIGEPFGSGPSTGHPTGRGSVPCSISQGQRVVLLRTLGFWSMAIIRQCQMPKKSEVQGAALALHPAVFRIGLAFWANLASTCLGLDPWILWRYLELSGYTSRSRVTDIMGDHCLSFFPSYD